MKMMKNSVNLKKKRKRKKKLHQQNQKKKGMSQRKFMCLIERKIIQ